MRSNKLKSRDRPRAYVSANAASSHDGRKV